MRCALPRIPGPTVPSRAPVAACSKRLRYMDTSLSAFVESCTGRPAPDALPRHSAGQAWHTVHAVLALCDSWQPMQLAMAVTPVVARMISSSATLP